MGAEPPAPPLAVALDLALRLQSPYHLRATGATRGMVDGYLLVREGQTRSLLIPGSTLKGRLRDHAARLWAAAPGRSPCTGSDGCLLCTLFGAAHGPAGRLRFYDAVHALDAPLQTRSSVAIDPTTGTARAHQLFTLEVGPAGTTFVARIRGHLPPPAARPALGLLAGATALLRTLGGGKSRGLGWVRAEVLQARCGDEAWEPGELRRAFTEVVEGR
jgi:CRISPR/Cas system CSM-associated protein Csm3 (group 7 of RAMP superfamily)